MSSSASRWYECLTRAIPEFTEALYGDSSWAPFDEEGEVLDFMVLADLVRWLSCRSLPRESHLVARALACLEPLAASPSPRDQNLLELEFVGEEVGVWPEAFRELMGPNLRSLLRD